MKNNYDWSEMLQTIADKVAKAKSEEQMYRILKDFKDEFNEEYGKLSRTKRLTDGFRDYMPDYIADVPAIMKADKAESEDV